MASLAFNALTAAKEQKTDVLLIDTAGRLQNKAELMNELEKIVRVIKKVDASAPHAVLLVLDATVGQNALSQVEAFHRTAGVTGLVMTKLDGTARGGILVALAEKLNCRCISSASAKASTISRRSPRAISPTRSQELKANMDKTQPHPLFKLATELGPLIVFFVANAKFNLFVATGAFMVAIVAAMIASYVVVRHVPMMAIVTGVIVIVFGTLTLVLHDETFIKVKPTIIYGLFAAILGGGLLFGRSFIAIMFDQMFNLTPKGWRILTMRWALFFFGMAILNEIIWRTQTTDFWVGFKAFGVIPLTMIFAIAQMPLTKRYHLEPATLEASEASGDVCKGWALTPLCSLAPLLRGEGWGEGLYPRTVRVVRPVPPHPPRKSASRPLRKRGEVRKTASALLLGDDLVLDAVIGLLRDDILVHEVVFALVGPARDDLCGIGLADAGQRVELVGGGGVDVEQLDLRGRRHLQLRSLRRHRRHLAVELAAGCAVWAVDGVAVIRPSVSTGREKRSEREMTHNSVPPRTV